MASRKFTPHRDSDKQTFPRATSWRATYGTTAHENTSARYSATNFAIWWPFYLKMLEKTHEMCLGIIKIRSLKVGSKIWWATHVWRLLFTNTLLKGNLNATFTICFFRNSPRRMSILICWIWICLENETQFILLAFYLHYPSSFSCNLPFSSPENLCFSKMLLIIVSIQYSPYINVLYDNN